MGKSVFVVIGIGVSTDTKSGAAPICWICDGQRSQSGDTVYSLTDNGSGFKMEYAHKLFSPCQRLLTESDFPGPGIGLATVHRIIDRHGGRVWASSPAGSGATFLFTLPRVQSGGQL